MKNIEERRQFAKENLTYSERRMDLLLIAISGAGIYVCLETLKFITEDCREPHWLIWAASISFLLAVIINFYGQFKGRSSNYYDYLMCQAIIDGGENPTDKQKEKIEEHDKKADKYEKYVQPINIACTVLMTVGLLSLVGYFLFCF